MAISSDLNQKNARTQANSAGQEQKKDQDISAGRQAEGIVKQERSQVGQQSDGRLKNLANTRVAPTKEAVRRGNTVRISTQDQVDRDQQTKLKNQLSGGTQHGHGHERQQKDFDRREEQEEVLIQLEDQLQSQRQQKQLADQQRKQQEESFTTAEDLEGRTAGPGTIIKRGSRAELGGPLTGTAGDPNQEGGAQQVRNNDLGGLNGGAENSLDERVGLSTQQSIVSLESVIGPEATLTFREKMSQVWNLLEEGSTAPLDCLAHMPLNLEGQNAIELLMVESPQGVHFISFLRNSNDFEMLATFNHRALLPQNPSRQLVEAAIIAFQQVQTVASDAAQQLSNKLREIAESESEDMIKLGGIRAVVLAAKRSKESNQRAIDRLVRMLDEDDRRIVEQGEPPLENALGDDAELAPEVIRPPQVELRPDDDDSTE